MITNIVRSPVRKKVAQSKGPKKANHGNPGKENAPLLGAVDLNSGQSIASNTEQSDSPLVEEATESGNLPSKTSASSENAVEITVQTPATSMKQKRGLGTVQKQPIGSTAALPASTPASAALGKSFSQRLRSTATDSAVVEPRSSGRGTTTSKKRHSEEVEPPLSLPPAKKVVIEAAAALPAASSASIPKSSIEALRNRLDVVAKRTSTAPGATFERPLSPARVEATPVEHALAQADLIPIQMPMSKQFEETSTAIAPEPAQPLKSSVPPQPPTPAHAPAPAAVTSTPFSVRTELVSTTPLYSPVRPAHKKTKLPTASPSKASERAPAVQDKARVPVQQKARPVHSELVTRAGDEVNQQSTAPSWGNKIKSFLGMVPAGAQNAAHAQAGGMSSAPKSPKKAPSVLNSTLSVAVNETGAAQLPRIPSLIKADAARRQAELDDERRSREKEERRKLMGTSKDAKDGAQTKRARDEPIATTVAKQGEKKAKAGPAPQQSTASFKQAIVHKPLTAPQKLFVPSIGGQTRVLPNAMAGPSVPRPPVMKKQPTPTAFVPRPPQAHSNASQQIMPSVKKVAKPVPVPTLNSLAPRPPPVAKAQSPGNFSQANPFQKSRTGLPTPLAKTPSKSVVPSPDSVRDEDIELPDVRSE